MLNSQVAFNRLIDLYHDGDAWDNDNGSDDGSDGKSYEDDAQDDDHDEDNVRKVVFVEVQFAEVPIVAFVDTYFVGSYCQTPFIENTPYYAENRKKGMYPNKWALVEV